MKGFQIIREINDLQRVLYSFYTNESNVYLDSMLMMSRSTKRHRYVVDVKTSYHRLHKKDFNIKKEPEIPFDVMVDAVQHYKNLITFKRWERS